MTDAPQTAFGILAEWAWTKMNLENLQHQMKESPTQEVAGQIHAAIKAFRHALRKKKALDRETQMAAEGAATNDGGER